MPGLKSGPKGFELLPSSVEKYGCRSRRVGREGDVVFDPVGGVLRAVPVRHRDGETILRLGLVGDGHGDGEHFAFGRGGRVILGRRGPVAERDADRIRPGVHLGCERFDHVGMSIGDVVRLDLVLDDVVELEAVEEAVQLPLVGADRILVAPDQVVAFDGTGLVVAQARARCSCRRAGASAASSNRSSPSASGTCRARRRARPISFRRPARPWANG